MGVTATFLSAKMVNQLGILKVSFVSIHLLKDLILLLLICGPNVNLIYQAGAAGLIFQASLLTVAAGVYWSGCFSHKTPLMFFLCLVVSSFTIFTIFIKILKYTQEDASKAVYLYESGITLIVI